MRVALRAYTLSECMELMAEYVRSYESLGGENLLFCEDRLTLVAERALTRAVGGTFRSSVSTFARFLRAEGKTVSKQGSVMLVGEVMTKLQRENKLQCFTSSKGVAKNARYAYETLAQFAASQITPDVLKAALSQLPEDTLKRKVSDLALLYEGYLDALAAEGYLDESRYLTLLPKRIREEGALRGKNVFFLCYSSFTAQAKETIRAAIETAENVVGIFCGGEEELYTNAAYEAFVGVCKEYGKTLVKDAGTPLEGEAEPLRKGLFNPERAKIPLVSENIRLFEAEDKTTEAEYAAVKIKRLLTENPELRYRDFALLTPSVAEYSLPVKKAFSEYGIPVYIDEKRSMKQHPLSKFLLDCFRVVKESSPAATQALTSNYFFGESDEYRNYLLKFANYRGGAKRPVKHGEAVEKLFSLEAVESGRERFLRATEPIKSKGYGREYCRAVWKILEDFQAKDKLDALRDSLQDVAQKGYLSQIYPALESVLTEAERLVGGKEMTAAEFSAILEDGFDAMEISLIPLKADAVFVGDIAQSRIEKVSALFALGMTDAVPNATGDTAILSDKEIARLSEVKALLEPTVADVNRRARESVCLNLCTFTRKLYLSYPLAADGSEPSVSEIFRYIDGVFCERTGGKLLRRKKLSPADFPYKCSAPAPALRQMLVEKSDFERRADDSTAECSAVYAALKRMGAVDLEEFWKENSPFVKRGEELFFHEGRISPTSLEGYFACPFGHFADRGLRLKEREEATVMAVDSGNFIHALLEKVAVKADEFASEEDFKAYATQVGTELVNSSVYLLQQDDDAGAYSSKKLLEEGITVAVEAYKQIKNSAFAVEQTEAQIDGAQFIGKVDRVDGSPEYIRIIDYKTGKIDDTPVSYYTGQKLQMQLYMSQLQGERTPAGVFYFPASVSYSDDAEGKFRMRGYLNGDQAALLAGDKNLTEGEKSAYFDAALGDNKRRTKVMDEETFRAFIDYGGLVANKGIEELKKGYIAPSPYEGKCTYCKFGGMCGFNRDELAARKESSLEPKRIAEIAKREKGE